MSNYNDEYWTAKRLAEKTAYLTAIKEARKNKGQWIAIDYDGLDESSIQYNGDGSFQYHFGTYDTDGNGYYSHQYPTTQGNLLEAL